MLSLTHREIEIKLRVSDLPNLLRRLRGLGPTCHGRVFEQNTIYDTPASALHRLGRLLRLRIETPAPRRLIPAGRPGALLTSKAPVPRSRPSRYKVKHERELPLPRPRGWRANLRALGFRPAFRYEKYRSTFRLPHLAIAVDETPVGVFLELEGDPRAIDRTARALGFSRHDHFCGTYCDLYAAACRRRGRVPRNMLFSS
jgi:adenylate cyclase, class 2